MNCVPSHCIKCGKEIAFKGRPSPSFIEDEYELSTGDHLMVARCTDCVITPPEWHEVMAAVNVALLPHPLKGEIVKVVKSRSFIDIMKEMQNFTCECGNEITDNHVVSGNKLTCGHCRHEKKVKHVEERPVSAGKKAMEHNEKFQRREKKGVNDVPVQNVPSKG